jgi:hypothetical protein
VHRAVSAAQADGHINPDADPQQILFEIHGLILALHYEARFLKSQGSIERAKRGFEHILQLNQAAVHGSTAQAATKKVAKSKLSPTP